MALKPGSELWNYFTNIPEEGMAECNLCKQRLRNNRSYNLKLHLNKVHKNRSEIRNYFEINVLENLAVCKTCNQRLKNRLCNLRLHMRRFHNIEVRLLEDKTSKTPPSPQPYDEDQIQAVLKAAKRKMIEQADNEEKRPTYRLNINMNKATVIRSVIGLIVEDGVPPRFFTSKHIESILRPICDAISINQGEEFKIDLPEIEAILSMTANFIRKEFSNDLHCRLVSIKIDPDVKAPANTFCVSAQFIKEGNINKLVLGVINLKHDDQLREEDIKQLLYKFNIDSNQIISAFWNQTKSPYTKHVKNADYLNEIENFSSYHNIFLGDVKVEPYFGQISQLCLLDFIKSNNVFKTFLECRNLTKYISDESNGYYELFATNSLSIPQLDSPWQPGSTCKMMNRLYEARRLFHNVKLEITKNPEDHFNSNEMLWSFIEAFSKSTNYLQKSIIKYYSEELHIGDFYAQWLKCKLLTEKPLLASNNSDDLSSTMLKEIIQIIKKRMEDFLHEDRVVACLYLDPRFQRTLKSKQRASAIGYLKKVWCRAKLYYNDETSEEVTDQLFEDDEDAFLNEFLSNDLQMNNKDNNNVFHKIEEIKLPFQAVDTNILSFWEGRKLSDPEIQALSSICFAMPATEIYDQHLYAHPYRLDADSELSAFTKENLLYTRINSSFIDAALEQSTFGNKQQTCQISEDDNSNTTSTVMAQSSDVSMP